MKKIVSLVLVIALVFSLFAINSSNANASSLWRLTTTNNLKKMEKGTKKKIKIWARTSSEKITRWWTSNKKLKIVKRRKGYCVVKGRKLGKCYVKGYMRCSDRRYRVVKIKITIKRKSKVTKKNYKKIHKGMKLSTVKKKIGKPQKHYYTYEYDSPVYDEDFNVTYKHIKNDSYKWYNPYKDIYIYVDFKNNKVTDKRYYKY